MVGGNIRSAFLFLSGFGFGRASANIMVIKHDMNVGHLFLPLYSCTRFVECSFRCGGVSEPY